MDRKYEAGYRQSEISIRSTETPLTGSINFCQRPSSAYLEALDDCMGDPRILAGRRALSRSNNGRIGWKPDWDSRMST